MLDKNLFPYDLAIVAIFKNEAPYLREWLDYHLLAGVEHFYLYNNDSSDGYAEVLKPYVDANIVTLTDWPGKMMQMPAYNDALEHFKFLCRYMAFIDLDEFIFPKTGQSIAEVVDEIFSRDEQSAALAVNWQCFGSNGHERTDYSRGVLERFTSRAPSDWVVENDDNTRSGNVYIKTVANPRLVDYFFGPHYAIYFSDLKSINSNGEETYRAGSFPVAADRIVINHYYTKSREEFFKKKLPRGWACGEVAPYDLQNFSKYDRNEVFDDGILTYRAARAQSFSLEDDVQRFQRVEKVLIDTLTAQSPVNAPAEFFNGKLETFLTCRRLAQLFGTRIGNRSAEEYALVWLYQTLTQATLTYAEVQMFLKALPEILSRPLPLSKKILRLTHEIVIPSFCEMLKTIYDYRRYSELLDLQKFLRLIK